MNYRHQFHAGNIADVFKHLVLIWVLEALHQKETALCVIDTHAGGGRYRLSAPGEFEQGIGRLWPVRAEWPGLNSYLDLLASLNEKSLSVYPGSPWLIQALLRPQDRAIFFERHPEEMQTLRNVLQACRGVTLNETDAWAALPGLLPPREKRGLVFIDPPYERTDEFTQVARALKAALARWRNGTYCVWYPIKARRVVEQLHARVRALATPALAVEFLTLPEDVPQRLNGSGMLLINPPWKLEEKLGQQLPPLAAWFAAGAGAPRVNLIDLSGK